MKPSQTPFRANPVAQYALKVLKAAKGNAYITGDAGTGKSTLLKTFLAQTDKQVAVLAPTGLAALNVGGETIHKFCKFPAISGMRLMDQGKIRKLRDYKKIKSLDMIVIDEVSMVRADLLDAMDQFFRMNVGDFSLPFGGLQVVFFGDHFQLPPIIRGEEKEAMAHHFTSEHFFDAQCYKSLEVEHIRLEKNYRQQDADFIKLLTYLRYGVSETRLVEWINRTCLGHEVHEDTITITATNQRATDINYSKLELIDDVDKAYNAIIHGDFTEDLYPTEKYMVLKIGAQVMFIRNDADKRWVNGTIGVITDLAKDWVEVRIGVAKVRVERETWEHYTYEYDEDQGKTVQHVTGEFCQIPLKLAWAVTIHKSQGQTYESCVIDLGNGAFVAGQTYVAFSRCRTLTGIRLARALRARDIIADTRVRVFDNGISWNMGIKKALKKEG
jgi:ATP-dependent DNA helicase PIF1